MSTTESELQLLERAYDSPPWWYDLRGLFILTFSYRSHLGAQVGFFGSNMGAEHLEGAVGSGSLLDLILKWRWLRRRPKVHIVAYDYAEPMLVGARARFEDRSDVEVLRADASRLPFAEGRFDTVNIANAAHCFNDLDGALAEARRVLRPGGTLAVNVLLTPRGSLIARRIANAINDWGMNKGILFRPYEEQDVLERMRRAGLEVVSSRAHGNALEVLARKPEVK